MKKLFIYYNNDNDCQFYQKHGDYYYLHTKTSQGEVVEMTSKKQIDKEEPKVILRNWNNKIIGFRCSNIVYGSFNR
jgi:hypothetical protein